MRLSSDRLNPRMGNPMRAMYSDGSAPSTIETTDIAAQAPTISGASLARRLNVVAVSAHTTAPTPTDVANNPVPDGRRANTSLASTTSMSSNAPTRMCWPLARASTPVAPGRRLKAATLCHASRAALNGASVRCGRGTSRSFSASRSVTAALKNVSAAQPARTRAGPETAKATVARSGPRNTLVLSQYAASTLRAASSRVERAIDGANTAHAGRSRVVAATATSAPATTTATDAPTLAEIAENARPPVCTTLARSRTTFGRYRSTVRPAYGETIANGVSITIDVMPATLGPP